MPPLRDPGHERVAQALAAMKTPVEASREAGYKNGTSFAPNARKRAQRKDIRARVAEIQAKEADLVSINVEWIRRQAAQVAGVDLAPDTIKASDKVAALNLLAKMTQGALVPQKLETEDGSPIVVQVIKFAPDKDPASS